MNLKPCLERKAEEMTRWLLYKKTQTAHAIIKRPDPDVDFFVVSCGHMWYPGQVKVLSIPPSRIGRCKSCERYAAKWR
jgi:hypothetical protein